MVCHAPTVCPEWLKAASLALVTEAGVDVILHALGTEPVLQDGRVSGAIFESKEGRRAILARVTVDCTGDGDLFARAGARHHTDIDERDIHHCMNTCWLFGGVDMPRHLAWRTEKPEEFSEFLRLGRERFGLLDKAFVSWRNDVALFMGPRLAGFSALKVDDLTEVEIRSRRLMLDHLAFYRAHAPGFENAYLMLSAPQLGVRHARRLAGVAAVTRADWDGRVRADEIGVSPSLSPKFPNVSDSLWRAGAGIARWAAGGGAAHLLRSEQPFLPARDPPVLADRPGAPARRRRWRRPQGWSRGRWRWQRCRRRCGGKGCGCERAWRPDRHACCGG